MSKREQVRGRGRGYWTGVVAEFERSGERQGEFCERRDLGLSALEHWLYRLRREKREQGKPDARFVPLAATAVKPPGAQAACKLAVGGTEVSFAEVPPVSYVVELLRLMDQ